MTTVTELVAAQRRRVRAVTNEALLEVLDDAEAVVIDVREPSEVEDTGRIPGAICIPRGMLEFKVDPTSPIHDVALDPRRLTVVYCATGGRSALAAGTLLDLGYDDVAHLEGGMAAWSGAGHPVEEPGRRRPIVS